jgi:hypothetical protein
MAIVFKVIKSMTDPKATYLLGIPDNPTLESPTCNCPAYKKAKSTPRWCKHLTAEYGGVPSYVTVKEKPVNHYALMSAMIKSIRIRDVTYAVHFGSGLYDVLLHNNSSFLGWRRLVMCAHEDNLDPMIALKVGHSASKAMKSLNDPLKKEALRTVFIGEIIRLCRTANWWSFPGGRRYIKGFRIAEGLRSNEFTIDYLSLSASDAAYLELIQTHLPAVPTGNEGLYLVTDMIRHRVAEGVGEYTRWIACCLAYFFAVETLGTEVFKTTFMKVISKNISGEDVALEVEFIQRHKKMLSKDLNAEGVCLGWYYGLFEYMPSPTHLLHPELVTVAEIDATVNSVTAQNLDGFPDWVFDGIHIHSKKTDQFAGTVPAMYGMCQFAALHNDVLPTTNIDKSYRTMGIFSGGFE